MDFRIAAAARHSLSAAIQGRAAAASSAVRPPDQPIDLREVNTGVYQKTG